MIELISPADGEKISLLTDVMREFVERQYSGQHVYAEDPEEFPDAEDSYAWLREKYGKGFTRNYAGNPNEVNLTKPQYIKFSWKADVPCHVEITCSVKYPNDPQTEILPPELDGDIYTCEAGNFFMRTEYSWQVVSDDGKQHSELRRFVTLDEFPRAIFAQGGGNIRDLGGLKTYDGKSLRQGCVYRGGALECYLEEVLKSNERSYSLTPRGKHVLRDLVRIKKDIDIRKDSVGVLNESPLGGDVELLHLTLRGYELFYDTPWANKTKELFDLLADESNYPVYLHCMVGADRTGTVMCFLEMLLGVSRKDLIADYNITSLSLRDIRLIPPDGECDQNRFLGGMGDHEPVEETVKRNCEKFLMDKFGITMETIEKVRKNLIEE
ncbi:MAG: tyrosine-protein phosphatase [Clostridia bacterium]|nr:tyrosine-protein phosphatase [Clostridia bacterium]